MDYQGKSSVRQFVIKYFYAFLGAAYLLTIGVFKGKNRTRLGEIAKWFGWKNPEQIFPTPIPEIDPKNIIGDKFPIAIREPVPNDGNVSLLELLVINAITKMSEPKSILEIGTFDGRTTLNLAVNSPTAAKIYTLDLPETETNAPRYGAVGDYKFIGKARVGGKFQNTPEAAKITQLRGDSLTFNFSKFRNSIDLAFVDGNHDFKHADSDTKNALGTLRSNGVILWHDYRSNCEGVTKTVNGLYDSGGKFKNLRRVAGTNLAILLPDPILKVFEKS